MSHGRPPGIPAPRPPVRVLVVDDSAGLRELLQMVLELEDDFDPVGQAGDGAEAVTMAGLLQPDLVVLDVAMPQMDGMAALPLIRSAAPAARVVMFSAFADRVIAEEARLRGAVGYVEKGLGVLDLVTRLRQLAA